MVMRSDHNPADWALPRAGGETLRGGVPLNGLLSHVRDCADCVTGFERRTSAEEKVQLDDEPGPTWMTMMRREFEILCAES
jgi:hypothetical protein